MRAFTLLALAGLTPFAFAAQPAHDSNAEQPPVEVYVYGMQLDVAHVIATTDVSRVCGVTSSIMTYEDHQGRVHRLQYRVQGGRLHRRLNAVTQHPMPGPVPGIVVFSHVPR